MKKPLLLVSLLTAGLLSAARADVIIGNLESSTAVPSDVSRNSPVSYVKSGTAYYWKAVEFTMGSTAYDATSVTFTLEQVSQSYPLTVTLYSANGGAPGALLYTFSLDPSSATLTQSNSAQNYTFDAPDDALLGANTSYFIVVQQLNTSGSAPQTKWMLGAAANSAITPTSIVGVSMAGGVFGQGNSSNPANYATGGGGASSAYNWFELDGTAVSAIPEASTCALLLGAMAGLVVCVRRFRGRRD